MADKRSSGGWNQTATPAGHTLPVRGFLLPPFFFDFVVVVVY